MFRHAVVQLNEIMEFNCLYLVHHSVLIKAIINK